MTPRSKYLTAHCVLSLGIVFGAFSEVQAGTIQGVSLVPGTPARLTSATFSTLVANDFMNKFPMQPGKSENTVSIFKDMSGTPVDINFTVANFIGGVTRYFVAETVTNATNKTWTDFEFQLGYFSGAKFVVSNTSDGLDFDVGITGGKEDPAKPFAPNPTSNMFGQNDNRANPNVLTYTKGAVAPGDMVQFTFTMDVPDFNKNMPADAKNASGYNFTLRENFSTPEPSSLILMAIGALALLAARGLGSRVRKRNEFY